MPILDTLAAADAVTPFWQSSEGGVILGGIITLAGTLTVQGVTGFFTRRSNAQAAKDAARARWNTLQIDTITELQEEIEALAAYAGNAMAATALDNLRTKTIEYMPLQTAFGRSGLLLTRLEDPELRTRIRQWLRDTRGYLNSSPPPRPGDKTGVELREERIEIVAILGEILQRYHRPNADQ